MKADDEGMERLGISHDSVIGARVSECGFDVHTRDDGLWAEGVDGFYDTRRSPYNEYLKARGYPSDNPWADARQCRRRCRRQHRQRLAHEECAARRPTSPRTDSETPWLTSQAIAFLESDEAQEPWLCHLSYIKPHWPYIVPAPYHDMYDERHIQPAIRHPDERVDPHPVYAQFMGGTVGRSFQRDEVRESRDPCLHGADQAVRRPDGPAVRPPGEERSHGRYADRA